MYIWMQKWLPFIRDFFQILFFIVICIVTVLTYRKAKKTLLQPIRTEVFKEQLKAFSEILRLLTGKSEVELREDFAFDKLLDVNAFYLFDSYASHFFDIEIDWDTRPYKIEECPQSIIAIEAIGERFRLVDDYVESEEKENTERTKSDPRTKAAIWSKYEVEEIKLPKELLARQDEFQRAMDSPLLPKSLVALMEEYTKTVEENIFLVRKILAKCAQEMPEKYPNLEELNRASIAWIRARYISEFSPLEEKAKAITNFLRDYFTIDTLMD